MENNRFKQQMEFQSFKIIQDIKKVYMRRFFSGLVYIKKFEPFLSVRNVKLQQHLSRFISFVLGKFNPCKQGMHLMKSYFD